jgi:mono/diheme cytochrome c family protein
VEYFVMVLTRLRISRWSSALVVALFSTGVIFDAGTGFSPGTVEAADTAIDFNRDIRPILANNCFTCHGPDGKQRKAKLRLDTRKGAMADLDGVQAIVPGNIAKSEMITRLNAKDPTEIMPPKKTGKKLKPHQIELLTKWIKQDAPYAEHWAYIKPVRPKVPQVKNAKWSRNPIDQFILAKLESKGLKPSAEADRYALIRRASLDLTGLPPTLTEADAFAKDAGPDAYSKLIDRLLAKKTYGEHWARMWLDLARYADSAGYADDPPRTIWGYRDYVIKSFNANKPFDQFTIEQIAGDLLPEPTLDQLIATGFHRNTQTNNEGGTNDEEYRNVAIVDRVNTTMAVWMGTTINCAQCHTHKYDPISQEEYFQFFAIFNNTEDADRRNESPTVQVWASDAEQQKAKWLQQVAAMKKQLSADSPELRQAQAQWEKTIDPKAKPGVTGRFVRVQIMGRTEFLSLAEVQVFSNGANAATKGKATQSSTDFGGPAKLAIDGKTNGDYNKAKSTTHTKKDKEPWWQVDLGKEISIERIAVWNRSDGAVGSRLINFKVSVLNTKKQPVWEKLIKKAPKPSQELVIGQVPANLIKTIAVSAQKRNAQQKKLVADYYRSISPLLTKQRADIVALEKKIKGVKAISTVPIMRQLASNRKRTTKIQLRGNYLDTGAQVTEGLPAAFHGIPKDKPVDRMTLARWLVDPNNALTARVVANRYWEKIFGAGIVVTSEEFGSQGELPTHPQLLDWLATELVASGWDIKHLLKLMLTSATYRQSSKVTAQLLEQDSVNRLLTRGPRFRLSAEMIRDQALFAGGLLSKKMYGPPVRPFQPTLGIKAAFGSGIDWKTSAGEDRYRRGLYTTWRRSNPYPSMTAFDAPNREVCIVRRSRTNTPLQALVTLNDPVYIEAAQALARRVSKESSTKDKLTLAFRLCLTRHPSSTELSRLVKLYDEAHKRYAASADQARKMATDPLGPPAKDANITDLAALTLVSNVLLNLDEIFMKR